MKVDAEVLLKKINIRIERLQNRSDRGFGSGFDSRELGALKELTWLRGALKRGEFDVGAKEWETE